MANALQSSGLKPMRRVNCAEISFGHGPRCLLLCRLREFGRECFP